MTFDKCKKDLLPADSKLYTSLRQVDGTTFDKYKKDYQTCSDYSKMNMKYPISEDGTTRQIKVHTCFKSCREKKNDDLAKRVITEDRRPLCSENTGIDDRYILCLQEDTECENTVLPNEVGYGDFKIAFEEALMAVALSTIPQFIFEYLCIYLIKVKHNPDKASENCYLLSF